MPQKKKTKKLIYKYIHRDISWLSFNERVLQEAEDKRVPLNERVRFLGIFSNNQDEFFRVRVATMRRMVKIEKTKIKDFDVKPSKLLSQIQKKVLLLKNRFDNAYLEILEELKKENIFIVNEKELTAEQGEVVKDYFQEVVRPKLFPVMVDTEKKLPSLSDKSIYLAIRLRKKGKSSVTGYSLIEVPDGDPSRFLVLHAIDDKEYIILLDDIIRYNLKSIYHIFDFDEIEAYTIKITRDAELSLDQDTDLNQSTLEILQKSIKRRVKGEPVRFIYDAAMPADMLSFFTKKMKLQKEDAVIPGARYHNFKNFVNFPNLGKTHLLFTKQPPVQHPYLQLSPGIFSAIKQKDVLLHFPYQSFTHVIDFLREAAINPSVTHIHVTLYRVAKNSSVVMSLINAARNGKHVTVIMELQARFDEENNIYWSNKLQEEGAKVVFGENNLKVHAKLCLVTENVNGKIQQYAMIGTGNFNENTAKTYTDLLLLTAKPEITKEIKKVFSFFENQFNILKYKNILLAPLYLRKQIKQLINREIKFAKAGKPAEIFIKVNNIADKEIVKKLYEASMAGVKIRLIVRGACSVVPGVEGLSENIEGISILDKYLEHARIYYFHNNGKEEIYIGSADMLERNIDFRVEVLVSILDKKIRKQLKENLEIQWSDNQKARSIGHGKLNEYIQLKKGDKPVRSQLALYDYYKNYSG
ncbi:MAG: polyphosphate kinase 1 [Fimbriimonadaceae bacterium]|nr:polyphosphate kinase 1 [Chitinophagales bacterium]